MFWYKIKTCIKFSGENLEEVSAALDELDSVIEALSVDVIKAKVILTHPVQGRAQSFRQGVWVKKYDILYLIHFSIVCIYINLEPKMLSVTDGRAGTVNDRNCFVGVKTMLN